MQVLFKNKEKQIGKVISLGISLLIPNRSQPRTEFDETALNSLAESIKENGLIQPVCVRRCGALYEIISGERRTRAAKLCGMTEIPCIIIEADDERSAVLALIENIQRKDLNYFEEAVAIERLIKEHGMTQEDAAKCLGKAQPTIANKLRLLRFTGMERELLIKENISERHARSLLRIEDEATRLMILHKIIDEKLSLEQADEIITAELSNVVTVKRGNKGKAPKIKLINLPIPRLYINSINKIVDRMKAANILCETRTNRVGDFYEYTILVPATGEMNI